MLILSSPKCLFENVEMFEVELSTTDVYLLAKLTHLCLNIFLVTSPSILAVAL